MLCRGFAHMPVIVATLPDRVSAGYPRGEMMIEWLARYLVCGWASCISQKGLIAAGSQPLSYQGAAFPWLRGRLVITASCIG